MVCLFGFRGLGYSPEFVENMNQLLQEMKAERQLAIQVTDEPDDICRACPYDVHDKCIKNGIGSELIVKGMDRRVMQVLNIATGEIVQADAIFSLVRQKIRAQDLKEICQGCQWQGLGYCVEGLERGWV